MSQPTESKRLLSSCDTFPELAFVLRAVEMAFGVIDESGVIKLPKFVAADSNPVFPCHPARCSTAGGPSFMLSEPFSAKNAATLGGFWLHHASA
jgi:hypothetical protein